MAIQRVGEKLVKKSVFVEKDDHELIVKYSGLRDQSISAASRELMSQSRIYILGRAEKIEQEKFLIQEVIGRHGAVVSIKDDIELGPRPDQFADYRAPEQADSPPSENNRFQANEQNNKKAPLGAFSLERSTSI